MVEKVRRDRVFIRKSDREDYKLLQKKEPFKGKANKEVFMMAMAVGFHEGSQISFRTGEKDGFFLLKDLNDKEKSIFYAIAVAEKNLNTLSDENEVYSIAENYANGGIKLLKDGVFSGEYGSYVKKMESELIQIVNRKIKDVNTTRRDVEQVQAPPAEE